MKIIKLLFAINFILSTNILFSQDAVKRDTTDHNKLFVKFELFGVTALPLSTLIIDNFNYNARFMGGLQYELKNGVGLDVIYGSDRKELKKVRFNFYDFDFRAQYLQLKLNLPVYKTKAHRTNIGFGCTFGKITESGVIKIGDQFFDPFEEFLTIDENFFGWLTSLKFEFDLPKRLSLELDTRIHGIYLKNTAEIQTLEYIPSGGMSWSDSSGSGFSINSILLLKYQLL